MMNRQHQHQRPVRRPVILAAVALVGAAVLLVALRPEFERPDADVGIAADTSGAPEPQRIVSIADPASLVEPTGVVAAPNPAGAAPPAITRPSERIRLVMLPALDENSDPAGEAVIESVRQVTLRELRVMPNIEAIEIGALELAALVPPNAGNLRENNLVYLAVARQYPESAVAEISGQAIPDSSVWSLWSQLRTQGMSSGSGGRISRGDDLQLRNEDIENLGVEYAERIALGIARRGEERLFAAPRLSEARGILLDVTRAEDERLRSLAEFRGQSLDREMTAAAIDLATRSSSAQARQRVWQLLGRSTFDPALSQPLNVALLSDPDAAVRKEAAFALAAYLGDAGTRPALEHALQNDSSPEVRLAARLAMMDRSEHQTFARETLFDRSLPPAERLAPTVLARAGLAMPYTGDASERLEVVRAFAEIVTSTDDPEVRIAGLSELRIVMAGQHIGPEISRVLIENLGSEDARVRRAAVSAFANQADNPEVRATLESVVENDPALAADLRLAERLSGNYFRAASNLPAPQTSGTP